MDAGASLDVLSPAWCHSQETSTMRDMTCSMMWVATKHYYAAVAYICTWFRYQTHVIDYCKRMEGHGETKIVAVEKQFRMGAHDGRGRVTRSEADLD